MSEYPPKNVYATVRESPILDALIEQTAKAAAQRIHDDRVMLSPEIDLARYTELQEAARKRQEKIDAHRKTCTCPYCGIEEF